MPRRGWLIAAGLLVLVVLLLVWRHADRDEASSARPDTAASVAGAAANPGAMAAGAVAQPSTIPAVTVAPDQEATLASGIHVRLKRRLRLEAPPPPWGAAYAELLAQAQAGEPESSYRLGLMLYECREIPDDGAQLEARIDGLHQTRALDGWEVSDPAAEEQKLRQRAKDCAGIPQPQREAYRDWIKAAADAGLIEAQLNLMRYLPPGEYCQYLWQCSPAQVAQLDSLHQEAQHYVGLARDAGSVDALWTYGGWLIGDEVLPVDSVEAYAYFAAYDQIQSAAGLPRRFDRMLTGLGSELRPVDRQRAQARMEELLSNPECCVFTP